MSHSREREEFVAVMLREGIPIEVSRAIMRDAATLQRYAENDCNLENWRGSRHNSDLDECGCSSCRRERAAERRIRERLKPFGASAQFQGDPRGPVVKVTVPSGYTNDYGHEGIAVP